MEYLYSAMLLHAAGKEVTEASVSKVLKSAGVDADTARVKALVTTLADVDIDEAIKTAAVPVAAAPAAAPAAPEAKAEETAEEEEEKEEESMAGLGALFG